MLVAEIKKHPKGNRREWKVYHRHKEHFEMVEEKRKNTSSSINRVGTTGNKRSGRGCRNNGKCGIILAFLYTLIYNLKSRGKKEV